MQTTLRRDIALSGTGLHSGRQVRLVIRPAAAESGIWFKRVDVAARDAMIPAAWDAVTDTILNTRISNLAGVSVSTIEHLMAALAGCGVSNALIEIDGPEVPILDGSARDFVAAIRKAGLRRLGVPRRAIRVRQTVEVAECDAWARLEPAPCLEIAFQIDFEEAAIGRQSGDLVMVGESFIDELSDSRTFCRHFEVEALKKRGLALGGSLDNAVVVDGAQVLNPGGFRHADECVRHKMLDVVGDLALAGAPILGRYTGFRAGHGVTNRLLRALFLSGSAIEVVTLPPDAQGLLGLDSAPLRVAV